jgi:hypothetical protein
MYLRGFHDAEIGQKIANCELGFEQENNRYFLSTTVTAESIKEAKRKGELRLNQVLSVFVIHTGITYPISGIHVSQISGRQPFLYSSFMTLETMTYLPISKEKIEEIGKLVELLDKLPSQKHSTKRVDKAINYFLRGCYLETQWRSESFLNFYKAIELISHHFKGDFSQTLINQLRDTLLKDSTEKEIQELLTPKRLIQFACGQLGIGDVCGVSKIVTLRNQFGAHARLEEVTVSPEDFNNCKILASRTILKYANYIQTTKNA